MKRFLVLASVIAVTSAGIAGLGGGSGFAGIANIAGIGGYSGGGIQAVYPHDGGNQAGFNAGISGFSATGVSGFGGGGISANSGAGGYSGGDGSGFGTGGQIRKFVSVHVGPEEPQITQTKVIRAGGVPDKHVNIIFVKAPSASNQQVIVPVTPQVYVLVKKQESSNNVRVRGPAPTRASRPEVYFIRYKDGASAGTAGPAVGGNVGPAYGAPTAGVVGVGAQGGY